MVRFTNHHNLPEEIVKAILADDYDKPGENTIPCSVLINPARISILSKRHEKEIVKDVSEEIWALLGHSVHYILSKQGESLAHIEKRVKIPFNGYFISGKPDYFNPVTGVIRDFKVTSVWKYIYGPKEGYADWENQLNVYAWLLTMEGHTITGLEVTAILRDWQKREAMNNLEYPDVQIKRIPLPLWDTKKQEEFISERLNTLIKYSEAEDKDLPVCTPSERWTLPTKWAIMKEGRKSAVRVLDSEEEAKEHMKVNGLGLCSIVKRPGEDRRCDSYCDVCKFCSYYIGKST